MAAGLVVVAPAPGGAATVTAVVTCVGADETSQILLDTLGGSLQVAGTAEVNVPETLAPGESAPVSFAVEMKPDQEMIDLAIGVGITSINGTVDMSVTPQGGSGGPYVFPSAVSISIEPQSFPIIETAGTVTAGDGPIEYVVNIGVLNFQTVGGVETAMALNCSIPNPVIGVTQVGSSDGSSSEVSGSGGQSGASTTLRQGATGTAQARVTG